MGPESFEAIGISWLPSPFTAAPIENSPPGIQAIPSGAGLLGLASFTLVGANPEVVSSWARPIKGTSSAAHNARMQLAFFEFSIMAKGDGGKAGRADVLLLLTLGKY